MTDIRPSILLGTGPNFTGVGELLTADRLLGIVNEQDLDPNSLRYKDAAGNMLNAVFTADTLFADIGGAGPQITTFADLSIALGIDSITSTDPRVDYLITLSGLAANSSDLGTFTGTLLSDNLTVKAALQEIETLLGASDVLTTLNLVAGSLIYQDEVGTANNLVLSSTDTNNQITIGTDGKLYVGPSALVGETLTTLTMLAGSILNYVDENGATSAIPIISTDTNNWLASGADLGLYVPNPVVLLKATTDWNLVVANYELDILAAEHGLGADIEAKLWDTQTQAGYRIEYTTSTLRIDRTTGDIKVTVSAAPDGRLDAEVIVRPF